MCEEDQGKGKKKGERAVKKGVEKMRWVVQEKRRWKMNEDR